MVKNIRTCEYFIRQTKNSWIFKDFQMTKCLYRYEGLMIIINTLTTGLIRTRKLNLK